MKRFIAIVTNASLVVAASAGSARAGTARNASAEPSRAVQEDPKDLAKLVRISEASARKTALSAVPGGTVASEELEREHGRLVYSYDIRVSGKTGIEEIQVSAMTGKVVSHVHESEAEERRESDQR